MTFPFDRYPRLLLVSPHAFNSLSGGGIHYTNNFGGWPKEKIAVAHSDILPPSYDVCNQYYQLGKSEFRWRFPFSLINIFSDQEKLKRNLKLGEGGRHFAKIQKLSQAIFGDEPLIDVRISHLIERWIDHFKPEVLYSPLGNLPYIRLIRLIANRWKLPCVLHILDDWPNMLYQHGLFGPYQLHSMQEELHNLIMGADTCIGICDMMSREYERRYQRPFLSFHNSIDADMWLSKSRKEWTRKSPFIVTYCGTLVSNAQLHSIFDVARAISALHLKGMDIEFHIFSPWYCARSLRERLSESGISIFDAPDSMDIESVFIQADLLLLPVNFDEASIRYIKYSMPGKIPAYMMSGTPILAYGPSSVAPIQYAQEFEWAYCVTEKNPSLLGDALKKLASDGALRKSLALRAQEIALKRHDRKKVRAAFHEVFIKTAERSRHENRASPIELHGR